MEKIMITLAAIKQAAELIRDSVIRTPLVYSSTLSSMFGAHIYLKLENLQKTGAFKIRGASYKLLKRRGEIRSGGVVAASAGNHAQGVSLAASQAGIPATIVMPQWASISKQEATRGYGGKVVISGQSITECLQTARELSLNDKTFIHPFDDPDIIAGQGTIGLEIAEELPGVDMVVIPVGGGGLISGIASAMKSIRPEAKVIGVQTSECPSAVEALRKGAVQRVHSRTSIADGISVKEIGQITFDIIRKRVDDVVLVDEDHIAAAILMLLERKKILAEGAGAVSLAALLSERIRVEKDSRVVLVISGGNVDSPLLERIIGKGLLKNGRIMRFDVRLDDTPGSLAALLVLISDLKANVLHIYHDRAVKDIPIYETRVELELETRCRSHIDDILQRLTASGYDVQMKG